jgi:hypothetical protein
MPSRPENRSGLAGVVTSGCGSAGPGQRRSPGPGLGGGVALAGLSVHRAAVTVGQWQPRVHSRGRAIPDSPIFGQSGPRFAFPAESGTGGFPASSLSSRIRPNRETGDPLLVSRPNRESESRGMGMGDFGFWSGHPGPASAASCRQPERPAAADSEIHRTFSLSLSSAT